MKRGEGVFSAQAKEPLRALFTFSFRAHLREGAELDWFFWRDKALALSPWFLGGILLFFGTGAFFLGRVLGKASLLEKEEICLLAFLALGFGLAGRGEFFSSPPWGGKGTLTYLLGALPWSRRSLLLASWASQVQRKILLFLLSPGAWILAGFLAGIGIFPSFFFLPGWFLFFLGASLVSPPGGAPSRDSSIRTWWNILDFLAGSAGLLGLLLLAVFLFLPAEMMEFLRKGAESPAAPSTLSRWLDWILFSPAAGGILAVLGVLLGALGLRLAGEADPGETLVWSLPARRGGIPESIRQRPFAVLKWISLGLFRTRAFFLSAIPLVLFAFSLFKENTSPGRTLAAAGILVPLWAYVTGFSLAQIDLQAGPALAPLPIPMKHLFHGRSSAASLGLGLAILLLSLIAGGSRPLREILLEGYWGVWGASFYLFFAFSLWGQASARLGEENKSTGIPWPGVSFFAAWILAYVLFLLAAAPAGEENPGTRQAILGLLGILGTIALAFLALGKMKDQALRERLSAPPGKR